MPIPTSIVVSVFEWCTIKRPIRADRSRNFFKTITPITKIRNDNIFQDTFGRLIYIITSDIKRTVKNYCKTTLVGVFNDSRLV